MTATAPRLRALLALVLLVGAGLRLHMAWSRHGRAPEDGEAVEYHRLGLSLREEGVLSLQGSRPTAARTALYPAWLSLWLPGPARAAGALLGTLGLLLAFQLGSAVHSPLAGLLAAGACAVDPLQVEASVSLRSEGFVSFVLLGAALALARWARRPAGWASWTLGAWLGALLSCAAAYAALPLCLAAWGARQGRGAWLLVSAYAMLLPWTARNARQFGELIPFEHFAMAADVYAASLGTPEPLDSKTVFERLEKARPDLPDEPHERLEAMRREAWRNVKGDPLGFLATSLRRLALFTKVLAKRCGLIGLPLAAFALWRRGREPALGSLAMLTACLAGVFVLQAPNSTNIGAMLPVVLALAAAGGAQVLGRGSAPQSPTPDWTLRLGTGLVLCLYLLSLGYLAHDAVTAAPELPAV